MPKSKEQFVKMKEDRKEQIALCGLKVFCEKGYNNTTVDDIVKKAKCSHGLFYHYFKSKKEIFDQVTRLNHDKKQENLAKLLATKETQTEKLRAIVNSMFNDLKNDENFTYYYYLFLTQSFSLKEKSFPPPKKIKDKNHPLLFLENIFSQGQKNGEFTDKYSAEDCVKLFISILHGATIGYVIAPKEIQNKMKLPNVDFIIHTFSKGDKI